MINKTWSFSRYKTFEDCPRALWLDEHSNGKTRNLVPLHSLLGTSVHKAISFWLDNWSKDLTVSNREVKQVGINFIRKIWKNRNEIITEYVNGTESDDSLGPKIERTLNKLIDNFFLYIWPIFANYNYLTHENLYVLNIKDYKILVKPDLITKDRAGNLIITDWKSSTTHDDSVEAFQVSAYGLWASNFYEIEPDRIILQVVNLRTGRSIRGNFSQEEMEETSKKIEFQIKELNKIFQKEILAAKPEVNKCKRCPHLQICDEGKRNFLELEL